RAMAAQANGITIYMDAATAQRARGVTIDWVETARGAGLSIDNPNAPPAVQPICAAEVKQRLGGGQITAVDVRPPDERAQAQIAQPFRTIDDGIDAIAALPKDTQLA